MIYEMAHITVKPGTQADFETGVQQALLLFQRARGFHHLELHHVIEHPEQYVLQIQWETLEDHMQHFRESDDFQAWRGIVGGFFAQAPQVVHTQVVGE